MRGSKLDRLHRAALALVLVAASVVEAAPPVLGPQGKRVLDSLEDRGAKAGLAHARALVKTTRSHAEDAELGRDLLTLGYSELAAEALTNALEDKNVPAVTELRDLARWRTRTGGALPSTAPAGAWLDALVEQALAREPVDAVTFAHFEEWVADGGGSADPRVQVALAIELTKRGDVGRSEFLLDRSRAFEGDVRWRLGRGMLALKQRNLPLAERDFDWAVVRASLTAAPNDDFVALRGLGKALAAQGRTTSALAALDRAIDLMSPVLPEVMALNDARDELLVRARSAGAALGPGPAPQRRAMNPCTAEFAVAILSDEIGRRNWLRTSAIDRQHRADLSRSLPDLRADALLRAHRTRGLVFELDRVGCDDVVTRARAIDRELRSSQAAPAARKKELEAEQTTNFERIASCSAQHGRAPFVCVDELAVLADAIPPGDLLVELLPAGPSRGALRHLALTLSRDGSTDVFDLGSASDLDRALKALRLAITTRDSDWGHARDEVLRQGQTSALVDAVASVTGVVHVVAEGMWQLVPLEVLAPSARVVYVPSSRTLLDARTIPGPAKLAAFLNPDLTAFPAAQDASATRRRSRGLAEMSFVGLDDTFMIEQCNAFIAPYPRAALDVRWGAQVSEGAFLATQGARFIHVAAHAAFADAPAPVDDIPDSAAVLSSSALILAGAAHASPMCEGSSMQCGGEDGFATALEISQMRLADTQLVVLASCESAVGTVTEGEPAYGIHRALQLAGAHTVVGSLWEVHPSMTQDLMRAFYSRLWAGDSPSRALAVARALVRDAYAHPHDWAGFIAFGRDDPVPPTPNPTPQPAQRCSPPGG